MTVLCIEDNIKVQMINKPLLEAKGFAVKMAMNLREAGAEISREMPSLIILDIHLPDGNGLDFLRELRKTSMVPVIALTNNKEESDIVEGLASGCDDYIPKPYAFPVLYARIEALLRRVAHIPGTITIGAITINVNANQAFINGVNLELSKDLEFSLFYVLAQNESKTFMSEELYEKVWGQQMKGNSQALSSVIKRVRGKIKGYGYTIESVHGVGYRFEKGMT